MGDNMTGYQREELRRAAITVARMKRAGKIRRNAKFECGECGKKFYSAKAAWRASIGDFGCPKCGSSDIQEVI